MSWALRRQLFILLILGLFIGSVVFLSAAPKIFKAPSCTDGTQNGTETGVDCGGGCVNYCANEVKDPTVLWYRSFPVTDSIYNSVAYIENSSEAANQGIPYEFRLYDDQGIFITRVDGVAIIPPSGRYAIVETGIDVGKSHVGRTTFAFSDPKYPWQHIRDNIKSLRVSVSGVKLENITEVPKLSGTISNPSPTAVLSNINVSAILYDASDNAIAVSRTLIPTLGPSASEPIFFTWPKPLTAPVVRYETLPIIDVFQAKP